MTIKVNPIVILGLFIGVALLIFAMIRGCNNSKSALADNQALKDKVAWLQKDSIDAVYSQAEFETRLNFQEGQIKLWQNMAFAKGDSLMQANNRINNLIARHITIKPSIDTNITSVPNEYVQDCEGCFTELEKDRGVVSRWKQLNDSLQYAYIKRDTIWRRRDSSLRRENDNLRLTLRDAIDIARQEENKNKPTGKLLFSISTLLINANVPNGAGIGFGWQDKYNRIFVAKYFTSEYGAVKQAEIYIPLSLRHKR